MLLATSLHFLTYNIRKGKGASGLDGMLVDAAHLRHASTVANRAELLGLSGKPSGKERTQ